MLTHLGVNIPYTGGEVVYRSVSTEFPNKYYVKYCADFKKLDCHFIKKIEQLRDICVLILF